MRKLSSAIEQRLALAFRTSGRWIASRPFHCIIACLCIAASLSLGALFMSTESDVALLYSPRGNRGRRDSTIAGSMFVAIEPAKHHNYMIAYSEDGRNLLTPEMLNSLHALLQDLRGIHVEVDGKNFTFQDLCPKALQQGYEDECAFMGVVDLLDGPIEDGDTLPKIFPNITKDRHGAAQLTPLFAGGRVLAANGETVAEVQAWKISLQLLAGEGKGQASTRYSDALFHALETLRKDPANALPFKLAYSFHFSESTELAKSTRSDMSLVLLCFSLVLTFSFFVVRSYSDFVLSKGNVVWGAQLGVICAIGSAFGLMGFCGVKFNAIVSTTAFLLLGIGIDDAYVLIQAYHLAALRLGPATTVEDRIGMTLESAGVSILFTSLTNVLAFAVGATSSFPAVSAFCVYTAVGVTFCFLYQVVFFGAVLAIDAHREYCGVSEWKAWLGCGWLRQPRYDPNKTFLKDPTLDPPTGVIPIMPEVAWLTRRMEVYGRALTSRWASSLVLLAFGGYWVVTGFGVSKVGTGLDMRDIAPSDSYWTVYVNQKFYFFQEKGPLFTLAFPHGSVDWTVPHGRASALSLINDLHALPCIEPEPGGVWLAALSESSNATDVAGLVGQGFVEAVAAWLQRGGIEFQGDVLVHEGDSGGVELGSSRVRMRMEGMSTTSGDKEGVPCMRSARAVLDQWAHLNVPAGTPPPVITYDFFQFWDGSAVIVEQTARNLAYAAGCCFVATLLVLPHPVMCVAAMAVVGSILAGVVASMGLVHKIRIETISMIDLVISVGFSIDNVAHYCHAYIASKALTRRDKAIAALQQVGIPILLSDASTMLALLPLLGSKSRIFRSFFLILFTVLLLGALHAVVLLPVVLGLCGPLPHHPVGITETELRVGDAAAQVDRHNDSGQGQDQGQGFAHACHHEEPSIKSLLPVRDHDHDHAVFTVEVTRAPTA